jgi:hypothetical protein
MGDAFDDCTKGCAAIDTSTDPSAQDNCYSSCQQVGTTTATSPTAPAASGGGVTGTIGSLIGGLLGRGATPLYPYQTGPSTTEILLIAALGIGGVYLLTKD